MTQIAAPLCLKLAQQLELVKSLSDGKAKPVLPSRDNLLSLLPLANLKGKAERSRKKVLNPSGIGWFILSWGRDYAL